MLSLFDSYQKKLISIDLETTVAPGTLKMYSCGPTVYYYQHIGNMRAVWLASTIADVARLSGFNVEWTLNITDAGHLVGDVDSGEDKIEVGAKRENTTAENIIQFYTKNYQEQCASLHITLPQGKYNPRATHYINEQIVLALTLLQKGEAYLLEDGIYFDFQAFALQHAQSSDKLAAIEALITKTQENQNDSSFTGRDIKNTTKNPADFALWKFVSENSLQKWRFADFPDTLTLLETITNDQLSTLQNGEVLATKWGCPGWHSECVAMICGIMGLVKNPQQSFSFNQYISQENNYIIDLHLGGEDHIDIHHKNEILQSEALGFHLSKYWVHNKFVLIDGKKMSKSLGNIYLATGEEAVTGFKSLQEEGCNPLAYRLLLIEHHYTEQLNFTWEKLQQSQNRLLGLRKDIAQIRSYHEATNQINEPINPTQKQVLLSYLQTNLDTPKFLEKFQSFVLDTLNSIKSNSYNPKNYHAIQFWETEILKLDLLPIIPQHISQLAFDRLQKKNAKDFAASDELRAQIKASGYEIDDYSWGYGIYQK